MANIRYNLDLQSYDYLDDLLLAHLRQRPRETSVLIMQALRAYYLPVALHRDSGVLPESDVQREVREAVAALQARVFAAQQLFGLPLSGLSPLPIKSGVQSGMVLEVPDLLDGAEAESEPETEPDEVGSEPENGAGTDLPHGFIDFNFNDMKTSGYENR